MDDLLDTCWTWPYWKFGLKRDDLFGTLHDQYNTVPSPILDPEAFHHDVYEISKKADSADEFHRLLSDRKEQRLRELNETLESAAFEIIANPSLIGTEQWQHAVQLFRTKSFDSLVRYFASYLPPDHAWYKSTADSNPSAEVCSSVPSLTGSNRSLFEDDEAPIMTDEPLGYPSYPKQLLPPSPRSMTMCSDSSVASPIDGEHHDYDFAPATPARALSFSESEPDCCAMPESHAPRECADILPTIDIVDDAASDGVEKEVASILKNQPHDKNNATLQLPASDMTDSETPTPKPEAQSASFFDDTKPSLPHRRYRSLSPSRPHPLSERDLDQVLTAHRDPRNQQCSKLIRRERECSPAVQRRRRSPVKPATKIQKPLPETARARPRGRRWAES